MIPNPRLSLVMVLIITLLLTGCGGGNLPSVEDLPVDISDIPGIPEPLRQLPEIWQELGLPDLDDIPNLPQLENLPLIESSQNRLVLRGPMERRFEVGEPIPGTDIQLVAIGDEGAEFQIAGLRSLRAVGDSLDFDGQWPGLPGATYNLRLRIYQISANHIRSAGVHQIAIEGIQPQSNNAQPAESNLSFPYTANAEIGQLFPGTTYGYQGQDDRGALISGLPEGDYPYRKVGDSIKWTGQLRPEVPAQFNLRMLFYNESQTQVGGIVRLSLP